MKALLRKTPCRWKSPQGVKEEAQSIAAVKAMWTQGERERRSWEREPHDAIDGNTSPYGQFLQFVFTSHFNIKKPVHFLHTLCTFLNYTIFAHKSTQLAIGRSYLSNDTHG